MWYPCGPTDPGPPQRKQGPVPGAILWYSRCPLIPTRGPSLSVAHAHICACAHTNNSCWPSMSVCRTSTNWASEGSSLSLGEVPVNRGPAGSNAANISYLQIEEESYFVFSLVAVFSVKTRGKERNVLHCCTVIYCRFPLRLYFQGCPWSTYLPTQFVFLHDCNQNPFNLNRDFFGSDF